MIVLDITNGLDIAYKKVDKAIQDLFASGWKLPDDIYTTASLAKNTIHQLKWIAIEANLNKDQSSNQADSDDLVSFIENDFNKRDRYATTTSNKDNDTANYDNDDLEQYIEQQFNKRR